MSNYLQAALDVALRHIDDADTTEAEAEAILEAIVQHMPNAEADAAAAIIHHRREARAHQMQLTQLFTSRKAA